VSGAARCGELLGRSAGRAAAAVDHQEGHLLVLRQAAVLAAVEVRGLAGQLHSRHHFGPCRWAQGALHLAPTSGPESAPMIELLNFINTLITLYVYIIIAGAVMSWLIAFNVVNPYNQFVRSIWQGLNALTEPLLRPIRRWMPDLGGIDISPVVLIIACWFIQGVVLPNLAKLFV
jgi:YggT family protein